MFDFSWTEIALFAVVVLIFIKPNDLPVAMRTLSKWFKAVRRMAGEFQRHIDEMVSEADLSEARDQLRELRQFNLRNQVKRVIDPDDSLKDSLNPDKSELSGALPEVPAPLPVPPVPVSIDGKAGGEQPHNARLQIQAEALEKAPSIIPPTTAIRLIEEAEYWRPPAFIPPEIALHQGRRVRILSCPSFEKRDKRQHG
ncbi:Sec-independent protein translocase protein TatB [Acetobacteraceae bacterium ESL0709]|nr:Sec-independent protein translocase protein TatB [Acetobacteraceae bacterium ESL0697]MDF7677682.1 Sec-independent protein translocase protein TatB [Acetobacteraceae bacterium ESL0709]